MARFAFALLAVAGCASDGAAPEPVATGAFDGYEVIAPCTALDGDLGVIGRGSIDVGMDEIVAQGQLLSLDVIDIPSVWGSGGIGAGCRDGVATGVYLDDPRYLGRVVDATGAFLRAHDLALQVVIVVDAAPNEH